MKAFAAFVSTVALVPAMAAPQSVSSGAGTITLPLCEGGSLVIPLGNAPAPAGSIPCCAKGCHSDQKRKRFDLKQ